MSDALLNGDFEEAGFSPSSDIKYTYADYAGWELPQYARYELYHGTAYMMAAPSIAHQRILRNVFTKISVFLEGKRCEPFTAPVDVRLFPRDDEKDTTVVQPDILVVCDPQKIGKQSCNGAPDLVIEILSPSTSRNDILYKLNLYLEAGVREYWIIDPERKIVQQYILKEDAYMCRGYTDGSIQVHIFDGAFSLAHSAIFENIA